MEIYGELRANKEFVAKEPEPPLQALITETERLSDHLLVKSRWFMNEVLGDEVPEAMGDDNDPDELRSRLRKSNERLQCALKCFEYLGNRL